MSDIFLKTQYTVGITFDNDITFEASLGKLLGNKYPYWNTKEEAEKALQQYKEYIEQNTSLKLVKSRIRVRQVTEWNEVETTIFIR